MLSFRFRLTIILLFIPLQVTFSGKKYDFSTVDDMIEAGILSRTCPSAVLVIGTNKEIIYQNAYGRLTYDDDARPTAMNTIYDLASVTKVIATTAAIMKLYDESLVDLNAPVFTYIPEFAVNDKSDIKVINLLLHNSGLTAWTPFYKDTTLTSPENVKQAVYSCAKEYQTGTMTTYSDYNAFLLGDIVERITGQRLDAYCKKFVFSPLGMRDTDFLVPVSQDYRIAPTEYDTYWRNQLLVGYVHDEMAAMLEGVSGNAGLFSTGPDLFKFMQMMLNNGKYINELKVPADNTYEQLFAEQTVELFTTKQTGLGYNNTRALGWETKPEPTKYPPQCGSRFSQNSFGHTGYTGTSVWADKDKNLIIIFLTNRVHPRRGSEEIKNLRPRIYDEVCRVMGY